MISPGLVSVTYRALPPAEIIALTAAAGLKGIEWAGDVHVPPNDLPRAAEIARQTRDAGLSVSAYGSYYGAAESEAAGLSAQSVIDTAVALGAPTVRIWVGARASAVADPAYVARVQADCWRMAEMAKAAGLTLSLEFHGGTLTDTSASAQALLLAVRHPALRSYWQPRQGDDTEIALLGLSALQPWLSNVHVFHWWPDPLPLQEGRERWLRFLRRLARDPAPRWASLEFVPGDDPAILAREAAVLSELLASV